MKRETWTMGIGAGEVKAHHQLDNLHIACEIVKAAASGGGGQKWVYDSAGKHIEATYKKIEEIRNKIVSK